MDRNAQRLSQTFKKNSRSEGSGQFACPKLFIMPGCSPASALMLARAPSPHTVVHRAACPASSATSTTQMVASDARPFLLRPCPHVSLVFANETPRFEASPASALMLARAPSPHIAVHRPLFVLRPSAWVTSALMLARAPSPHTAVHRGADSCQRQHPHSHKCPAALLAAFPPPLFLYPSLPLLTYLFSYLLSPLPLPPLPPSAPPHSPPPDRPTTSPRWS